MNIFFVKIYWNDLTCGGFELTYIYLFLDTWIAYNLKKPVLVKIKRILYDITMLK